MDPHSQSQSNEPISLKIYYTLKRIVLIISIYYIEKIMFIYLLSILYYSLITLIFQIFLHLLLIRYLVLKISFAGQSYLISRNMQYKRGILQATYLNKELIILRTSLKLLYDGINNINNLNQYSTLQRNIKNSFLIIKKFYEIFHKMKEIVGKLSYDQNIFYNNISTLKISLTHSDINNFLNDVIKILRKEKISNIFNLNQDKKDEIYKRKNEINKNIENINNNINILLSQINDYIGNDYNSYSPRYIRNYFYNDLFASLNQFNVELDSYFILERKILITKDNYNIDYIIIKSNFQILKKTKKNKKKLIILCGPNADPYQIYIRTFPVNLYLSKNIDILCWNYRGYGYSTGKASFDNMKNDISELYQESKKNYNYEKIGVHGISIGGVSACFLAKNFKEIKLLVSDRNFGQIEDVVKNLKIGKYLLALYKLLFIQSSRNVENYLNSECFKIILNDPGDEIVPEEGALKTIISEKLCQQYIGLNINNKIIENNTYNNNVIEMENIEKLDTLDTKLSNNNYNYIDNQIEIEDDESSNINTSINTNDITININNSNIKNNSNYNLIHQNSNLENNHKNNIILNLNENKSVLDLLLSSEKKEFIQNIINISEFIINEKKSNLCNLFNFLNNDNKYNKNSNLNPNLILEIKNKILNIFYNFKSAGDTLQRITEVNNSKYILNLFLENFFNNLFIWGTYNNLDEYNCIYNSTEYIDKMISKNIFLLNNFLSSKDFLENENESIIIEIKSFYNFLQKIKNRIKLIGIKTPKGFIHLTEGNKYENELIKIGRGNLVSLTCGHNGLLSEEENIVFKFYLNKSELFKDDEEDINNIDNNDNEEEIIDNNLNNNLEDLDASFSGLATLDDY